MTKTELETKNLSDLHQLAADAGVERYRMLTRAELIGRLSDGGDDASGSSASSGSSGSSGSSSSSRGGGEEGSRPKRRRRRSSASGREREERQDVEDEEEEAPPRRSRSRKAAPATAGREDAGKSSDQDKDSGQDSEEDSGKGSGGDEEGSRPKRRRRRRRFGRRREGISIQDLLLPAESGRQAVLLAESSEAATELLRGVAADLAADSDGPDAVALLIDPSPEELADWKREAPQAELVSAGQARHANDALATAQRRAGDGEDVILLIDSLTRFAESFGDTEGAKALFDAGRADTAKGKGSLTVVVALERS